MLAATQARGLLFLSPDVTRKVALIVVNLKLEYMSRCTVNAGNAGLAGSPLYEW